MNRSLYWFSPHSALLGRFGRTPGLPGGPTSMKSAFSPAALRLRQQHAGSVCASELDDEQFDELGEDMASKLDAFKGDFLATLAILDARLEAVNVEFLAKLALLDAKFEAKFIAVNNRLDKIETELVLMRWGFGLMFVLQAGILAKLFFP
jgi:hypothetical protein